MPITIDKRNSMTQRAGRMHFSPLGNIVSGKCRCVVFGLQVYTLATENNEDSRSAVFVTAASKLFVSASTTT